MLLKEADFLVKRLSPHQDLKQALVELVQAHDISAGCVISAVGSLQQVHLRMAGANQVLTLKRPHEIVSITGTLSSHGLHLHLSVAGPDGTCWGGHLLEGNLIHTTCELVIAIFPQASFERTHDPATGFKELHPVCLVKPNNA